MPPHDMNGTTDEHPLSDYVRDWMSRTDLSARQLAKRAVDPLTGRQLLHTYISALAANEVPRVPDMWRLRALAAGMSSLTATVDEDEYQRRLSEIKKLAAIQWLDLGDVLQVDTGGGTWITVPVPPTLSERRRQRIIRWAKDMAEELDQED